MSKFQIGLLSVFGLFIIGGLMTFALYKPTAKDALKPITIWGTVDQSLMNDIITSIRKVNSKVAINYVQYRDDTFTPALTEALATRQGPDAILVSQDMLFQNYNKLIAIPYTGDISETAFDNTFIPESQSYLSSQGIIALPFAIDPLVMYWNKDIFTNANVPLPPTTWEEFKHLTDTMTIKDAAGNITQSAVGLGEYKNITNAKDILSLLMMQAGNPIVSQTSNGLRVTLGDTIGSNGVSASDAALSFYTQFANVQKQVYTWNRSLDDSKTMFIGNKLGVYFGFASDYNDIRQKNPNLNFDVAIVPQVTPAANAPVVKSTFGKLYGLSMVISTADTANTIKNLELLISQASSNVWTTSSGLPSVRLDSLASDPSNAVATVFTTSALWSKGWLDPDRTATDSIFQDMIENVTSNRETTSQALTEGSARLTNLFQ